MQTFLALQVKVQKSKLKNQGAVPQIFDFSTLRVAF